MQKFQIILIVALCGLVAMAACMPTEQDSSPNKRVRNNGVTLGLTAEQLSGLQKVTQAKALKIAQGAADSPADKHVPTK